MRTGLSESELPMVRLTSGQVDAAVERLARRFSARGFRHPNVAAVATTARGLLGIDLSARADRLGVDACELQRVEAGEVSAEAVPPELLEAIHRQGLRF